MKFISITSSNIVEVAYDKSISRMHVKFTNGNLYVYSNVPENTFNEFLNSESKGRFFAQNIKNNFEWERR